MPIRSLDVLLHSGGGGLDPGIALLPSFLKTSTLVIACLKENVETVLLFFNGGWIGIPIGCWAGKNSFTDTKMNIRVDSSLSSLSLSQSEKSPVCRVRDPLMVSVTVLSLTW